MCPRITTTCPSGAVASLRSMTSTAENATYAATVTATTTGQTDTRENTPLGSYHEVTSSQDRYDFVKIECR